MRKLFYFFALLALPGMSPATGLPGSPATSADPRVILDKMWVDFDVSENGEEGLRIHASLTIHNMKGMEGALAAFFKYSDGKPDSYIKHPTRKSDKHHTSDGSITTQTSLIPVYEVAVYEDIELFFPYREFELEPGEHDITIQLMYWNASTKSWIAWLKLYDIVYTEPDASRSAGSRGAGATIKKVSETSPRAVLDSIWLERDVQENNETGLRLHFRFSTFSMKDTAASVAAYFLYNSVQGGTLKDKNNRYGSAAGDVAAYISIKPGYETTFYNDLPLFIPYAELHLPPGNYELLIDTKLIYDRGGLISNFQFYGFTYTQR